MPADAAASYKHVNGWRKAAANLKTKQKQMPFSCIHLPAADNFENLQVRE